MGSRGRTSAAALSVIGPNGIQSIRRPEPPKELNPRAAQEWRDIVNRMPPDWFPRETHPMLSQLCRLVVRSNQISRMIEAIDDLDGENFNARQFRLLLVAEQRVSEAISRLSTKMRISQQSSYDAKKKRKGKETKAPWQEDED